MPLTRTTVTRAVVDSNDEGGRDEYGGAECLKSSERTIKTENKVSMRGLIRSNSQAGQEPPGKNP